MGWSPRGPREASEGHSWLGSQDAASAKLLSGRGGRQSLGIGDLDGGLGVRWLLGSGSSAEGQRIEAIASVVLPFQKTKMVHEKEA